MSREQLLGDVWKYESATETNVVDVYIPLSCTSKIDVEGQPSYIKTVRDCWLYHAKNKKIKTLFS